VEARRVSRGWRSSFLFLFQISNLNIRIIRRLTRMGRRGDLPKHHCIQLQLHYGPLFFYPPPPMGPILPRPRLPMHAPINKQSYTTYARQQKKNSARGRGEQRQKAQVQYRYDTGSRSQYHTARDAATSSSQLT